MCILPSGVQLHSYYISSYVHLLYTEYCVADGEKAQCCIYVISLAASIRRLRLYTSFVRCFCCRQCIVSSSLFQTMGNMGECVVSVYTKVPKTCISRSSVFEKYTSRRLYYYIVCELANGCWMNKICCIFCSYATYNRMISLHMVVHIMW